MELEFFILKLFVKISKTSRYFQSLRSKSKFTFGYFLWKIEVLF